MRGAIRRIRTKSAPTSSRRKAQNVAACSSPGPSSNYSSNFPSSVQETVAAHLQRMSRRNLSAFASSLDSSSAGGSRPDPTNITFEEERARELTKTICNNNSNNSQMSGSFTPEMWHQATNLTRYWASLNTETSSLEASLALLDRLVAEQSALFQTQKSGAAQATTPKNASVLLSEHERKQLQELTKELLNTQLLNEVLKQWNVCWKTNKTNISPKQISQELLQQTLSPSLLPDTKSYNLVLAALSKRYNSSNAVQYAKQIFDKMVSAHNSSTVNVKNASKSTKINGDSIIHDRNQAAAPNITPDVITYTTIINFYSKAGNAQAAEDLLSHMHKEYLAGHSSVQPNMRTFTSVVSAWARSGDPTAPEKAESIVQLMHLLDRRKKLNQVRPNLITYNALLDCWAKSGRAVAGAKAEELLRSMEAMSNLQPDTISYNTTIVAYLSGSKDLEGAEAVLRRQIAVYRFKDNVKARPDVDSFNIVLEAIHKSSAKADEEAVIHKAPATANTEEIHKESTNAAEDTPLRAERLLKHMIQIGLQPNLLSFNSALGCWANSNHEKNGGRAEFLLHEMMLPPEKSTKFPCSPVQPNTLSYNYVINAYSRSGKAQSAEMIFRAMYKEFRNGNKNVRPTLKTFNTVLSAWSHNPTVTDAERLKEILHLMAELPRTRGLNVTPDTVSYNTLLSCLSRIDSDDARTQAERVLLDMERGIFKAGNGEKLQVDKYAYTTLMKAFAMAGDVPKTKQLFVRMLEQYKKGNEKCKPDRFAFHNILQAISKNAKGRNFDAGKEAEAVFKQMNDFFAKGILDAPFDKFTYDLRINCWGNSANFRATEKVEEILGDMQRLATQGHSQIRPDAITFSSVINAHSKVGNNRRAEELLRQMFEEYTSGNKEMKPTLQTINIVLASLARSKEPGAAEKASAYLKEMLAFQDASALGLKPDVVTFTTVISCWANSGDPMAAEHAKALFRELELLSQSGDHIHLDAGFYRSMLLTCARSGDTACAESLLKEIVNGDPDRTIKPDKYMFEALLEAYAASGDEGAVEKAEALLQEMHSLAESSGNPLVKPDEFSYLTVLSAWANSDQTEKAVARSEQILFEMEERYRNGDEKVKPGPATYSRVINIMARAGDIQRTKKILRRIQNIGNIDVMVPANA